MMVEKTKICTKCKYKKLISEFYKDKTHLDGLHSKCKECLKKYRREYRQRPEVQVRMKKYHQYPEVMIKSAKRYKKGSDNLKDVYVKTVIANHSNLRHLEIPESLIEQKREHLLFYRELQTLKKGVKSWD